MRKAEIETEPVAWKEEVISELNMRRISVSVKHLRRLGSTRTLCGALVPAPAFHISGDDFWTAGPCLRCRDEALLL